MYNLDRIAGAVKDIEDYFKKLELFKKGREIIKENEDVQAFHASAMMCLSIINRAIDLATDIIVQKEISMPTRYKEIFSLMAKEGILSKELGIEMEELAEERNYLAHEYFGLDDKRMARILRKINFVKDFIERVKIIIAKEMKRGRVSKKTRDLICNKYKGLISNRSGVMELPFGMIFSIFLIAIFIVVAIYAINYFLNLQKCTQVNLYADDLQKRIDNLWNGQKGQDSFSAPLPVGIKMICFANLSIPSNANNEIYDELSKNYAPDANFYFYPGKYACGNPYRIIKHIKMPGRNPFCINAKDSINLEKDFYDALVNIKTS